MKHHIVIDARIRRASSGRPLDRLIEHLQDIDSYNHYTILLSPDDPWEPRAGNFRALPCPFPQFSLNPLDELRFAWMLYRLHPDLVHFGMTQQPLLYFGKIVTMTHDLTMFHFVRRGSTPTLIFWLKMRLYHFLMWWAHKKSTRIIVPTRTTAKELAEFQPFTKRKLVVTLEAAEAAFGGKAKSVKAVSGDFIMYVGTAFPHKNLRAMIEAFDILHVERPKLTLVLVGKAEKHYEELQAWAKTRPSYQNILFTGFLADSQVKWLFEHTQAYVFTSLSEGFGLPPLEAMTSGAPVVCSNASVMPEVYGDAAHYFDARNPKDIAQKIAEVLDNPTLRTELIAKGKQQVKKYSWRTFAEETLAVYKDILDTTSDVPTPRMDP
ncbi:MAG TPA: glycosyltransferase family 1 protein [Candidatus Saccharimonadales bacterium]|nr:glycosyltransferase family 1 protein [Candidatus Saccharimonadales bacterium]